MKSYSFFDFKSNKKKSIKHEKELARRLDGKRQIASGAIAGNKGDVKTKKWLVDLKETNSFQILVTVEMLRKIMTEASGMGKEPAIVIRFNNAKNMEKEYAIVPVDFIKELK